MFNTLFGSRGGNASSTAFVAGVIALAGSFYFSGGEDSKNALFLCATGAVLFGVSWFLDRSYLKERISEQARVTEMDSIYRDMDEIRNKIDCCKRSCSARMNEGIEGIHRRLNEEIRDVHSCIESSCRTSSSTDKCCKKQVLSEN